MTHNHDAELLEHLLRYYSFELNQTTAEQCVAQWRDRYPKDWLRSAIVEALYQGRYKAVSVTQILDMWQRRGQSLCHYNGEFERMICSKFLTRSFSGGARNTASRPNSRADETASLASTPDNLAAAKRTPSTGEELDADDESPFKLTEGMTPNSSQLTSETQPDAAPAATDFDAAAPEVSLLEEEFLEVFAAQMDGGPNAIAPFKPSAEVPIAAVRFSHDSMGQKQSSDSEAAAPAATATGSSIHGFIPTAATSDLYGKLKAALDRVVSSTTDKT